MTTNADAGLLVLHGIGDHSHTTVLRAFLDPVLDRLAIEHQLADVKYERIEEVEGGDAFDSLVIDYTRQPIVDYDAPSDTRRLFAIEGNWTGIYAKASSDQISAWIGRVSMGMVVQAWFYFARGWLAVPALLSLALFLCSLLSPLVVGGGRNLGGLHVHQGTFAIVSIGGALLVALATSCIADLPQLLKNTPPGRRWWVAPAAASTLVAYQIQRGIVLIILMAALLVLPIGTALLRLLSSVPFLSGLANSLLPKLEAALLTGGIADMEAVASDQVTAAVIRTHIARALAEVEERVKPGGTITLLAHSGGGPIAWRLLSEPDIHARQATKRFKYRLITVGSALNWAKRGFGSIATPLDGKLVNHDRQPDEQTFWLNCYGTWDAVPHGPVNPADFHGYAAWPNAAPDEHEAPPNQSMRNVGAPVPTEHSEYWRNQQEFVPALLRSIDEKITWAARDAGVDRPLWSNCRLALLSGLVRTRLALLALPLAAFAALIHNRPFLSCDAHHGIFSAAYTDAISKGLGLLLDSTSLSTEAKAKLGLCGHPLIADLISVIVATLLVYALLDVYTNFLWQSLGRRTPTMRPAASPPPLRAIPVWPGLLVWVPTLFILPAVLYPFGLSNVFFFILLGVNTMITALEVLWFNTCLRAFQDDALRGFCASPIGRYRSSAFKRTPAAYRWL